MILLRALLAFLLIVFTPAVGSQPLALTPEAPAEAAVDLNSPDPHAYESIGPSWHWRRVVLVTYRPDGALLEISLLRPLPWLELTGAEAGGSVFLDMPELGVRNFAEVVSVEEIGEVAEPGPGHRTVIGKFVTHRRQIVELRVEGVSDPIETTSTHPFWSEDRGVWVEAGQLRVGERLRTKAGTASVVSVEATGEREPAYNLEVHRDHTFRVSAAGVWVHNTGACGIPQPYRQVTLLPGSGISLRNAKDYAASGPAIMSPDGVVYPGIMHQAIEGAIRDAGLIVGRPQYVSGTQVGWKSGHIKNGKFFNDTVADLP